MFLSRLVRRSARPAVRQLATAALLKERKVGVIGLGMVGNAVVRNLQRTGWAWAVLIKI